MASFLLLEIVLKLEMVSYYQGIISSLLLVPNFLFRLAFSERLTATS